MLNGLDLFSGIGGITKALEPWCKPIAYCERDRYCQAILLSRMANDDLPGAPIWDDVRSLTGNMVPNVDIIYGGFPCQDISVAGNGRGLDGERSGLVFEVIRLINEIKPTFVFLENVPAIRTRGCERVVKELSCLGYDSRWDMLSAKDMGAPHKRSRWFLLAANTNSINVRLKCRREQRESWKDQVLSGFDGQEGTMANANDKRQKEESGVFKRQDAISFGSDWWEIEPELGRVADGIPFRVDRLRGLGNSVVPQQAREAFKRLMGLKHC